MAIGQYVISRVDDGNGVTNSEAVSLALGAGGQLASLTTAEEDSLFRTILTLAERAWIFEPHDSARVGPWIGLSQPSGSSEPGGNWTWASGEALGYTNWHWSQPDNYLNDDLVAYWDYAGFIGWADTINDPVLQGYGLIVTYAVEFGAGRKSLFGTAGFDLIYGSDTDNRVFSGDENDVIHGNLGADNLHGQNGNDEIHGGDGNDRLFGNRGRDSLYGGDGDDVLIGGRDGDLLSGGAGADVFVYSSVRASRAGEAFEDVIDGFDMAEGDRIDLQAFAQQFTHVPLQFVTGGITAAAQVQLVTTGGETLIEINLDADLAIDMQIELTGLVGSFDASAFLF